MFLCLARCELLAFLALDRVILGQPGGGDQGDDEAEDGAGQDVRGVVTVICDPRERGDGGHDEEAELEPDPGEEAAHLQPVLQIHLRHVGVRGLSGGCHAFNYWQSSSIIDREIELTIRKVAVKHAT